MKDNIDTVISCLMGAFIGAPLILALIWGASFACVALGGSANACGL